MRLHIFIFLALLAASRSPAVAEEKPLPRLTPVTMAPLSDAPSLRPKLDDAVSQVIDVFFLFLAESQVDKAYSTLTAGTKIAERKQDIATLKSKTEQAIEVFGRIRGHELIAVKNVGTHMLSATYLSLGKDFPLRWRFYFYRSETNWKLIDIRVDDRLVDMFDEPPLPAAARTEPPAAQR